MIIFKTCLGCKKKKECEKKNIWQIEVHNVEFYEIKWVSKDFRQNMVPPHC